MEWHRDGEEPIRCENCIQTGIPTAIKNLRAPKAPDARVRGGTSKIDIRPNLDHAAESRGFSTRLIAYASLTKAVVLDSSVDKSIAARISENRMVPRIQKFCLQPEPQRLMDRHGLAQRE